MATNTRKLADLLANIDNNSKITTGGLLDATITAADLADDSVGAAEIIDDAVTAAAIADDAVGSAAIADAAVDTARLAASAVTSAKIAASAVSVKPHIELGVLQPAVAGKDLDGVAVSTSHGSTYTYGTLHADGNRYYYTDIQGSKPIKDPRIGAHFGSQRHKFKSLQLLEQETATHGSNVYSVDGREWIRLVSGGSVTVQNSSTGNYINITGSTTFVEIVGYFSNANVIAQGQAGGTRRFAPYIDGGSAGTNTTQPAVNSPLEGRFVDSGMIQNLTFNSALTTPGIHTLKLLNDTNDIGIYGIELIAQDATDATRKNHVIIPAQNVVSYGKKFSVGSDTLTNAAHKHYNPFAFKTDGTTAWASGANNGTSFPVGTGSSHNIDTATSLGLENWKSGTDYYKPYNGGRVVRWVDSSGVIKTSVTVMPPNAQNVSGTAISAKANASVANDTYLPTFSGAIDNSLSEVAKTFWWREFGNGNANAGQVTGSTGGSWKDFSMLDGTTSTNLGYCMDDGLTSLAGQGLEKNGNGLGDNLGLKTTNSYHHLIFIGTGITISDHAGAKRTFAQNLPYGTHILKQIHDGSDVDWFIDAVQLLEGDSGDKSITAREITFHQPKKPPIPEDAVILADYMLMADFKPQTTAGRYYISKGVRRQTVSRDVFFNETDGDSFTLSQDPNEATQGLLIVLSGTADSDTSMKMRIPSFGTNYLHRGYQSDTRTKLFIGDTDKDSAATKDNTGSTGSYAHLTSDVELGIHQFGSNAASGQNGHTECYDIASPIHTSSHYQEFETPYLKELVGGDMNMEQTNLIVTPDGKSWDEVTRDTSYIGTSRVRTDHNNVHTNITNNIFDEWRGRPSAHDRKINRMNKDFAIAYDRMICLKDGTYQIIHTNWSNTNDDLAAIYINGTLAMLAKPSTGGDSVTNTSIVTTTLTRGDIIAGGGASGNGSNQWNVHVNFEILEIPKG